MHQIVRVHVVQISSLILVLKGFHCCEWCSWRIDGFSRDAVTGAYRHSPYSLMVGVALSDTVVSYRGNFCVFPESLWTLQEEVKIQVRYDMVVVRGDMV